MTLEELLDHVGGYLDDRTELLDGDADELWSDDLITRYLNEAQRVLCRRAWVIIDAGNPVAGAFTLVSGRSTYPTHKSVLYVFDATVSTDEFYLPRYTDADLRQPKSPYLEDFDIDRATILTPPGAAIAIASDAATRTLRVYPEPAAAQAGSRVVLKVARMPTTYLTTDDTAASPEVPEEWHLSLCDYACGRCLVMPNVSSQGKADGRQLLKDFDTRVFEARQERQRFERAPGRFRYASTTAML